MERPAKRMRMWKPQTTKSSTSSQSAQPAHVVHQEPIVPTRTIDLSDFRRRAFHAYRSSEGQFTSRKRNGVMYLMPRAPVATVTVKLIAIAVGDDNADPTPVTTVTEPTSDVVLSISAMGSLTIPGAGAITSDLNSLVSEIGGTKSTESVTSSSTNLSNSAPGNGTTVASGENTATVFETSTYKVAFHNGTFITPSRTTASRTSSSSDGSTTEVTSSADDVTSPITSDNNSGNVVVPSTSSGNNAAVVTITTSSSQPTASGSSGGGVTLTPQQQQVVGGVVGGVAGVALVLVALLYFLKWYRQRLKRVGQLPEQIAASRDMVQSSGDNGLHGDQTIARPQTTETQRSSIGPVAAIATRLKQLRPYSTNTVSTASTRDSVPAGNAERSFQRIAGRKIPSVLSAGGDGYGDSYGVFDRSAHHRNESQTMIYQDDLTNARPFTRHQHNSTSEPSTPTRSDPFADPPSIERLQRSAQRSFSPTPNFSRPSLSRDFGSPNSRSQSSSEYRPQFSPVLSPVDGFATLRPSPARTPMTQSPTGSAVRLPQPSSTPPLMAGYVPNLPTVPTLNLPAKRKTNTSGLSFQPESVGAGRSGSRSTSGVSGRTHSAGGRFREDIA